MKLTHLSTVLAARTLSFLIFLSAFSLMKGNHTTHIPCLYNYQIGHVVITGKVEEQSSGAPFARTIVMARTGNTVLDRIQTDQQGRFSLSISLSELRSKAFSLQVNLMDHIFIKENVGIQTEEILIQINGEVFVEDGIREEYKLPVHLLDQPKVGRVHTWMREQGSLRISG